VPKNPSNTALVVKNGRTVEVVNVTDEQTNISLDSWCVKIRTRLAGRRLVSAFAA
jgi:hypothetical protein